MTGSRAWTRWTVLSTALGRGAGGLLLRVKLLDIRVELREGHVAALALQRVVPRARREVLVVLVEHLLARLDALGRPQLHHVRLVVDVPHRGLARTIRVVHRRARVEEVDRRRVLPVADAVVDRVVYVPAGALEVAQRVKFDERALRHRHAAQAHALRNIDASPPAVASLRDLR